MDTFPIKYLGVPLSPSRLHVADWLPLIEKTNKKLDVWKGGSLPDVHLSSPQVNSEQIGQDKKILFLARGRNKEKISSHQVD
jgi:hypothetical protein